MMQSTWHWERFVFLSGLMMLVSSTATPSAQAETLVDNDEIKLDLGGAGQGTARLTADAEDVGGRFDLDFARLIASGTYEEKGSFFIQLGAKTGTARLLDARLTFEPIESLSVQAGRFKAPVSAEYLTSATDLLLTRRAALSALVFKRNPGGQLVYTPIDADESRLAFNAGLFSPTALTAPAGGAVGVARVRYRFAEDVTLHGAFAEHFLADNEVPGRDGNGRVLPFDRQVDLAFQYNDETWRTLVEGVYVFDGPGDTQPMGVYAHVARTFSADGYDLQPGVAYDFLDGTDGILHRGTVVLNAYWLETKLMSSVEYAVQYTDDTFAHVASLSMQAGF